MGFLGRRRCIGNNTIGSRGRGMSMEDEKFVDWDEKKWHFSSFFFADG
jgi:hypothetical protein